MSRPIALASLALASIALLGLDRASPRVVKHESMFPDHSVKPAGAAIEGRRRLGPQPPGHPRIVGDVRPDGGVATESAG
jgi:hypothetical protein